MLRLDDEGRGRALRRIGRVREVVVESTLDTWDLVRPYVDAAVAMAMSAPTKGEAEQRIKAALDGLAEDDEVAARIWRANALSNMGGELFVRDVELPLKAVKLAHDPSTAFLSLRFDEAIEHFLSRTAMEPSAFEELLDEERFRSFTVTRVLSQRIRERMLDQLGAAMEPEGPGLDSFVRTWEQDVLSGGGGPVRAYLENVYRTNTATSYNAGRYRAQTDPDVVEATGFWQYLTAGDGPAPIGRVRPSHWALDGKVWRIGDEEAKRVYPPSGHQCRCVMVVVDEEDVDPAALSRTVDVDAAITTGFSGAPGDAIREEAGAS